MIEYAERIHGDTAFLTQSRGSLFCFAVRSTELSLSEIDAANLKEWGFNLVRLGTMWPGKGMSARI
jgi:hypothetical protein